MGTAVKLIVLDIDGVLTDGTVIVDSRGNEQKKINMKDMDAVFELKRQGYLVAAVTGEDTEITSYFRRRFPWDWFISGNKNKLGTVRQLAENAGVSMEETAYVGDGKYDVPVLPYAGLSFCPADAVEEAKLAADVVLSRRGGSGCLWEVLHFLTSLRQPASDEQFFLNRLNGHQLLFRRMASDLSLMSGFAALTHALADSLGSGGRLFLCGNGGSAADAQHIAAEFIGRFYRERPAFNAEALTVNSSTLTAIGNDYGYEWIFVRQLEAKAKAGDILVGFTTSGASANVLEALRYARGHGITAAAFAGNRVPEAFSETCDILLRVPSDSTPRIQEAHGFLGHLLAEYVEDALYNTQEGEQHESI